jgi:hypothetical protein
MTDVVLINTKLLIKVSPLECQFQIVKKNLGGDDERAVERQVILRELLIIGTRITEKLQIR